MGLKEQGRYEFRNYTAIDVVENDELDMNITVIHEYIHLILTQSTAWGTFCYRLVRINAFDNTYSHLISEFIDLSRKAHEGTAVFFECVYIIKTSGYDKYNEYINNLRKHNPKYHSYIKPLLKFIDITQQTNISIDEVKELIYQLAIASLNSNILEIEIDKLKTRKSFTKFKSNGSNANKYFPNTRFSNLIKSAYKLVKDDYSINDIIRKVKYEVEIYNPIDEKGINEFKCYMMNMYENSRNKNEIDNYLNEIKLKYMDIKDVVHQSIPGNLSGDSYNIVDYKEYKSFIKKNNDIKDIAFVLGDGSNIFSQISRYTHIRDEDKENILETMNINKETFIISYMNYINKEIAYTKIDSEELLSHINEINKFVIVINYKTFNFNENIISNFKYNIEQKIYIYCDRSYTHSKEIIERISDIHSYTFIDFDKVKLLVISINEKIEFILPILNTAYKDCWEYMDIKYGSNLIKRIDDKSIDVYELIINTMLQL